MADWFARFSQKISHASGHYVAFIVALGLVIVWAASGPLFAFAETWQLVINTGTTIITFLMVFVLQSTQNRDSAAIHVKLDAIIEALDKANNRMMAAEDETEEELQQQKHDFGVAARAR